jgi:HD-GYP domain-containing protein (c-di-GMP phosphodiesterase class II)
MDGKRARLAALARQVIDQTPAIRPEKVRALREAVMNNAYGIDADEITPVLFAVDEVNLVTLLSHHPSLISEHLIRYRRNSRYWRLAVRDTLSSLQVHDHYTGRHSARVTAIVFRFRQLLGLPPADLQSLRLAGFFHDLGKITINQALLTKAEAINSNDRSIIENHPLEGGRIAEPLNLNPSEKDIILHHHERWDGRGYPHGLSGEEIPYLCRMVALADTFEALTSNRPYRRRFSVANALAIIAHQAASQFDPDLTRKFEELVSSNRMAPAILFPPKP